LFSSFVEHRLVHVALYESFIESLVSEDNLLLHLGEMYTMSSLFISYHNNIQL